MPVSVGMRTDWLLAVASCGLTSGVRQRQYFQSCLLFYQWENSYPVMHEDRQKRGPFLLMGRIGWPPRRTQTGRTGQESFVGKG